MKKKGAKRARASEREGKEQQLGFTRISRRCVSRETKTERSLGRGKPFVASMPTPRNRKMSDDSFSFPFFFRHGSAPRLSFFSFEMQISTRRGVRPSFPSTSRDARDHPSLARPSPLRVEESWTKKISDDSNIYAPRRHFSNGLDSSEFEEATEPLAKSIDTERREGRGGGGGGGQRLLVSTIKHRDVWIFHAYSDINLYHRAAICQLSNSR